MGNPAPPPPTNTASTSDVLSAIKNIVLALATAAQNYLNVQGAVNAAAIKTPTVVKNSAGRIASVSIIVAGSGTGFIYDGATLTATTRPLWVIPEAAKTSGEPYLVNFPTSFGLLVVPGTGQTVSVSYS
jgi:hypothetical protein